MNLMMPVPDSNPLAVWGLSKLVTCPGVLQVCLKLQWKKCCWIHTNMTSWIIIINPTRTERNPTKQLILKLKSKTQHIRHTTTTRAARWPPSVWFCAFFFGRNDFRCPETAAEWDLTCSPALTFFTVCCPHSFPFLSISAWGSASSTQTT